MVIAQCWSLLSFHVTLLGISGWDQKEKLNEAGIDAGFLLLFPQEPYNNARFQLPFLKQVTHFVSLTSAARDIKYTHFTRKAETYEG